MATARVGGECGWTRPTRYLPPAFHSSFSRPITSTVYLTVFLFVVFHVKMSVGTFVLGFSFLVLHITLRSHPRQFELSPRVELPTWMTGGLIFYTSVALVLCFDAHLPSCPAIPLPCTLGEKVLLPYTRSHPTPAARVAQSYIGPHVTDCGIRGRAGM